MLTLTIDGREVAVEPGTKVIEAARRLGIEVPFYCYHPGLSIAGNCRICMVEIEKFPKTQIACNTDCQEGMIVRTDSEKAKETRRHILEFLLANHPLDCPVCYQAGECWLQDYYMRYGLYDGRFYEQKVKKPKAVPIGPTVMLDAERCILCSRCVRFCDEITKTSELGIVNRGDHSEIAIHPNHELNNKYSGNVVDLCPVGALTDRDFRFKCRVWYLKKADSICPGCARGCNIEIHYNLDRPQHGGGERVMRLKPRENPEVNQWWICDEGRYGYKFIDENRIEAPLVRGGSERDRSEGVPSRTVPNWDTILDEVAGKIKEAQKKIAVFVSPQLSNEELYLIKKLFVSGDGSERDRSEGVPSRTVPFLLSPNPEGDQDDFLIRADKNPNTRGAELLGFSYDAEGISLFLKECEEGKAEGAVIFGQDLLTRLEARRGELALNELKWSVFIGSNHNLTSESASFVLPSATYAEKNGTFTNFEGRVQKFTKAFEPLGESRPEWAILVELARRLGAPWSYTSEEEIFSDLARDLPAFQ
jgi:NADH-quinone oxidoreductase subunit G